MNGLPAKTGLIWLRQGFALFRKQPGMLAMLMLSSLVITIMSMALPLLGMILPLVLIPSFTIAMQKACFLIDEGERVTPAVLLTGFHKDAIGPLFKLGMVYFGVLLLLSLAVSPWIDVESIRQAAKLIQANKPATINDATLYAVLCYMILSALFMLMLSFAPGVTYWQRMPLFKALFFSVAAVFGSARALLLMLLTLFAAYWLLGLLLQFILGASPLGFVVFLWLHLAFALICQCALYAAYKQILGAPQRPA